MMVAKFIYTLHLADNALLLGQRNSEWTGHGPVLEQDIAITNIALDYLGQARNFYQYAAGLYNKFSAEEKEQVDEFIPRLWKFYERELEEDDLAFLRDEHQYLNVLLAELPKGDWAVTILRQFFFSAFQQLQYDELKKSSDASLAAIAGKSLKEVIYHLRWSSEWVIRLGDGTAESMDRMKHALAELWNFTGELFVAAPFEETLVAENIAPNPAQLKNAWNNKVQEIFSEAGLTVPPTGWMQSGGKTGKHTEHMGYLLTEMQYLQRTFPNVTW